MCAALGLLALGVGCNENPVGRQCFIGTSLDAGGLAQTIVASPALECQSRTCLHIADKSPDLCTAECSVDNDCDAVPDSQRWCKGGFVCMVPTVVGDFCCKKLCVCRDYVNVPEGGMSTPPPQCDPANAANECCNLEGREGYPACQAS